MYIYIFTAAIILLFLTYVTWKPKVIAVEMFTVQKGPFEEVIKSDGRFRSKEKYTVTAFAEGILSRVEIKVGDPVFKGQKLADLTWDKNIKVRSPIDGVVSKVFRESEGPIYRGEAIVEIINPEKLEIVAELLTTDAVKVQKGNLVKVENWGGPTVLEAIITKISKAGYTKISALGVEEERTEIISELKKSQAASLEQLGNNFHIDVTIVVSKNENALKVPIGALFKDADQWAVYKVMNKKAILTHIEIDKKSFDEAVVIRGLNEGDTVILYPGDLIKNGTRVKLQKAP